MSDRIEISIITINQTHLVKIKSIFYGHSTISHYNEEQLRKFVEARMGSDNNLWQKALNKLLMYKVLNKRVE